MRPPPADFTGRRLRMDRFLGAPCVTSHPRYVLQPRPNMSHFTVSTFGLFGHSNADRPAAGRKSAKSDYGIRYQLSVHLDNQRRGRGKNHCFGRYKTYLNTVVILRLYRVSQKGSDRLLFFSDFGLDHPTFYIFLKSE